MKVFIPLLVLAMMSCQAQSPSIAWSKKFAYGDSVANSIAQCASGEFLICGNVMASVPTATGTAYRNDGYIAKVNESGTLLWETQFGGSEHDYFHSIQTTSDGGYIVAGNTWSNNGSVPANPADSQRVWVIKFDSNNAVEWNKVYGSSWGSSAHKIIKTPDGGYLLGGMSMDYSLTHGMADAWLLKLDALGNEEWQRHIGGSHTDWLCDLVAEDDGYVFCGVSRSVNGDLTSNYGGQDAWTAKVDLTGTLVWQKNFGGTGDDRFNSIRKTADGGYIAVGNNILDLYAVRMDSQGMPVWEQHYGGSSGEDAKSVEIDADGAYLITGSTWSADGDVAGIHYDPPAVASSDLWFLKIDDTGTIVWQKCLGGIGYESGEAGILCSDGGYLVGGTAASSDGDLSMGGSATPASWIAKMESLLSADEFQQETFSIFPNPATSTLNVHSKNSGRLDLTVTDINGRIVTHTTGQSSVNVEKLSNGIYFITIDGEEGRFQTKFIKQ